MLMLGGEGGEGSGEGSLDLACGEGGRGDQGGREQSVCVWGTGGMRKWEGWERKVEVRGVVRVEVGWGLGTGCERIRGKGKRGSGGWEEGRGRGGGTFGERVTSGERGRRVVSEMIAGSG